MRRLLVVVLVAAALVAAGCGSSGPASTSTLSAHPPRPPAGVTISITEPGSPREPGEGMTPLRTFKAAKQECSWWHAGYIAKVYGGISDNYASIAHFFATHRAAAGYLDVVRRGCRAGLHD